MRRLLWLGAAALLLAGCNDFRSLNPIADPTERMADPGITGDWVSVPEEELDRAIIRITPAEGKPGEYRVTFIDSLGNVTHSNARPTVIAGRLVVDVWPAQTDGRENLLPVHTPYFIHRVVTDTLVIGLLDDAESLLAGGDWGSGLQHIWMEEHSSFPGRDSAAIVTASTADIRRFLADVLARPGAFGDSRLTLRRLR